MAEKKQKPISEMNLRELDEFLKSGDITEAQRDEAMDRLRAISNSDKTGPNVQEEFRPPKDALEPKEDFKKGRQYAAHGGMIHRGRKAGFSAEKAR